MATSTRFSLRLLEAFILGGCLMFSTYPIHAQEKPAAGADTTPVFVVNGQIALHSLISLSDAHLQKLADIFTILSTTDAIHSGKWERIRGPLAMVAQMNVPGVYWFALPDGSYWTLDSGRVSQKLSNRAYFPRLLAGQTVLGELVVSRSTNRNTAIVAVPVRGSGNSIIGALGCSVHLDSLTSLIRQEIGGLENRFLFFAINDQPLGALNSNTALIFTEPMKLGDKDMQQAFRQILAGKEGIVRYTFRNSRRTVLFRKSPVTGWWYGFGIIEQ